MVEAGTKKMKAVVMNDLTNFEYTTDVKDVPVPRAGQVLIKVEAVPLNPSDLYQLQGNYNGKYDFPYVAGGEGSGTVISNGGGFFGWTLVGKRVAFTRQSEGGGKFTIGGTYAEYIVTSAFQCITLDDATSFEQGCNGTVNPLTAIGLRDRVIQYKSPAVVIDAAVSQLGKMMIRAFAEKKIPVVAIVRKDE
jgi:NADPH:quinone reductase-like Zn-dependent oxidoreductase